MKKFFIICFLLVMSTVAYSQNKAIAPLPVNTFDEKAIPKEIEGCSGYFYKTQNDKRLNQYVCVNDLGKYAFIKIGNILEKFIQDKYYTHGKIFGWIYHNQNRSLKLTIDVKTKRDSGYEESAISGTMTIEASNGNKTILKFVGIIGC